MLFRIRRSLYHITAFNTPEKQERKLRDYRYARAGRFCKGIETAQARSDQHRRTSSRSQLARFAAEFHEGTDRFNSETLVYNLTLPPSLPRREHLRADKLLERAL
ncbi:MAG: hypothetical protein OXE95_09930 [Chloroflexi bacterium]|nr:hypothetical protein [Chloroflexota bacterium]MCY4247878.1 hypothetical protein [Chloroflexota bacterium]